MCAAACDACADACVLMHVLMHVLPALPGVHVTKSDRLSCWWRQGTRQARLVPGEVLQMHQECMALLSACSVAAAGRSWEGCMMLTGDPAGVRARERAWRGGW